MTTSNNAFNVNNNVNNNNANNEQAKAVLNVDMFKAVNNADAVNLKRGFEFLNTLVQADDNGHIDNAALADALAVVGRRAFGMACLTFTDDDKKALICLKPIKPTKAKAAKAKADEQADEQADDNAALLALDTMEQAKAVLTASADALALTGRRAKGFDAVALTHDNAALLVDALAAKAAKADANEQAKAAKAAKRRQTLIDTLTKTGVNADDAAALVDSGRLSIVNGVKDSAGRYCFKPSALVMSFYYTNAAALDKAADDANNAAAMAKANNDAMDKTNANEQANNDAA